MRLQTARFIYFVLMRNTASLFLGLAIVACSEPRREGEPPPTSKVEEWTARAGAPRKGTDSVSVLDLELRVAVNDGWHVYSLTQETGGPTPMSVKVAPPYSIAGEISGPPPVKAEDSNFGILTETYSGQQVFTVPLKLAASSAAAPPPIEVKIRSQACSDKLCLPARTTTLTVTPAAGST